MRYCPNPRCSARALTGSQAEYLDHASVCSDCGAELVDTPGAFTTPTVLPAKFAATLDQQHDRSDSGGGPSRSPRLKLATGVFCVASSGLITLVTWLMAWGGGYYMIALGPLVYGLIMIQEGLSAPSS